MNTTSTRLSTTSWLVGLALLVFALAIVSLNVGASRMNLLHLFTQPDDRITQLLFVSRWPRTLALVLAGASLAVAGLLLQMMARNRLVDPSMMGTADAAALGVLFCAIAAPGMALWLKFGVAALCAAGGTLLFLAVLERIPLRSALIVPLVGLVLAGVIHAGSSLLAYQFELAQALRSWNSGDFSAILRGRYELLWVAAGITVLAMLLADRFTVIGMGKDFATNVGVNYRWLIALGVLLVSMVVASVVVIAGALPFIGLIVPNLIRRITGDHLRHAIPLVALGGAVLMLVADLLARVLIHPYEIPSANILAISGCLVFLVILIRGRKQWA
ncbi:ABC transporter permease [Marinobacter sp. 2_MG-2023]|uniref:ABC transporter permease n=1 Tax=Marinobacter sp. 2_MG-2023 TaxID=3062679 RepID=UPI0026E3E272|nr:iron chelate uptake ABC transporter family permease subunit [Marinobacter sp. 2_MG-2023]MDO6440741.1 iron chelate uptake ABC transporter family permease subunit [Marinobacter sp. 2_MG-2023]